MEIDPKKIEFWTMNPNSQTHQFVRHEHTLPVNGQIETCRTVFPKFDLGQWANFGASQMFVFATIERLGSSEVRALHPTGLSNLALHTMRSLE